MTHQDHHPQKVTDIIKVLNGGVDFYRQSIKQVSAPNVRAMLMRMIEEKQLTINALQPYAVATQGELETHTSWALEVRSRYAQLMDYISSDSDHTYVRQLLEVEGKILQAIDQALDESQPVDCAAELRRVRARIQQCHDEMTSLKKATA